MNLTKISVLLLFLGFYTQINSQSNVPINDDCAHAFKLDNVIDTYYQGSNYTNVKANETVLTNCFQSYKGKTVWYHFTAISKFSRIIVEGNSNSNGFSLKNVVLGLYTGTCGSLSEIICKSPNNGSNIAEVIIQTIPGKRYYLAVAGRVLTEGTFKLYINSFNNDPEPLQDCNNARILCDKSILEVEKVVGYGATKDFLNFGSNPALNYKSCDVTEDASNWYKWTCDETGTLEFTITPLKANDDIDFLVYELPDGIDNCDSKIIIRNMISGENTGAPFSEWKICVGPTGLKVSDSDLGEACGCQNGNNNFAAALNMVKGKSYAIMVMNFSQSGVGYHVDFGGSGTFLGPKPKFTIAPLDGLRCDQAFTITDNSDSNGNPLTYEWYFGEGANPSTSTNKGPFTVNYDTWGKKYVVLTVSDAVNGCEVTEVVELNAEPCCEDLPDLNTGIIDIEGTTCPWSKDGFFNLSTQDGGGPVYKYSIDGSPFVESPNFKNLGGGKYKVIITDKKGCLDTIIVNIHSPDSVYVDAGSGSTIRLGETTVLSGSLDDRGHIVSIRWEPEDLIESCLTCLDPTVYPVNGTTFTIIAVDENGCEYRDIVFIKIDKHLPIYIPNAFSPNGDGINDRFNAFGNRALEDIKSLTIYHRWGGIVYQGANFPGNNDRQFGWNGKFKGQDAEPGVYTYLFKVGFIDGSIGTYAGDVTLLK